MLGEDDVNLQEFSAKHPATGNVAEIKRKFHECIVHACANFCELTAEHRAGMQSLSLLSEAQAPSHSLVQQSLALAFGKCRCCKVFKPRNVGGVHDKTTQFGGFPTSSHRDNSPDNETAMPG